MSKPTAESIRDAFTRAAARTHLVRFVEVVGQTARYDVQSDSDPTRRHRVAVFTEARDRMTCGCPGSLHVACWHRAAVAIVRANREAHGLPLDGPSTAARSASYEAVAQSVEIVARGHSSMSAIDREDASYHKAIDDANRMRRINGQPTIRPTATAIGTFTRVDCELTRIMAGH